MCLEWKLSKTSDKETHFKSGTVNVYVENYPEGFTFFEFKIDNEYRQVVLENEGCKVTQIYGDKSLMFADP